MFNFHFPLLCLLLLLVPHPGPHQQVLEASMFWSSLEVAAAVGPRREVVAQVV